MRVVRRRHGNGGSAKAIVGGILSALLIGPIGCQSGSKTSPPASLAPPPNVAAEVAYHSAPSVGLRSTTMPIAMPGLQDALDVGVEWVAVERLPADLPPLLSRARLITAPRAADPLLSAGRLLRGAGWVDPAGWQRFVADLHAGRWGRTATIATTPVAALPREVLTTFTLAQWPDRPGPGPRIQLQVHRSAETARPGAIRVSSPTTQQADAFELTVLLAGKGSTEIERAQLDPVTLDLPAQIAISLPSQFDRGGSSNVGGVVALLSITASSQPPSADHRRAVAQCVADLQRAADETAASIVASTRPSSADAGQAGLLVALRLLRNPRSARSSLAYLADQTDAALTGDVALAADNDGLAELAGRITSRVGELSAGDEQLKRDRLGWLLDATCLEQLAAMRTSEKLPPELAAVLSVHAGEAGRKSASLDELARAGSREAFESRVVAENLNYLEDSSPAARVRAFDWLHAHDVALANYDPLAPVKERRKALDEALAAVAAKQTAAIAASAKLDAERASLKAKQRGAQ